MMLLLGKFLLLLFLGQTSAQCGCPTVGTLTRGGAHIDGPCYPKLYAANLKCYWHIQAPEGQFVEVQIMAVNTERNKDYVELFDGSSDNSESLYQ